MSAPKFSISILAYQNLPLSRKCIESVLESDGDFELLLTDNGCSDGTAAYFDEVKQSQVGKRRVVVSHNATNEGFVEPNRKAFRDAYGTYVVLLNNDTVVPKNWLTMLEVPFKSDPLCAISGPAGGCCQLDGMFHGQLGPRFEYLEGWMMCLDREKVASVEPNLFPPELVGAYGENSYISLRMREAGFNL